MKKQKKNKILEEITKPKNLPLVAAAILITLGLALYQFSAAMLNLVVLGVIVGIAPFALISYFEYAKIRAIEDQLPIFLLDLAESQKVGLTLHESLRQASKVDYGKLSPEIKKVYNQLSWGIRVQDVFANFAERMKKSKLTTRVVSIINETYVSGGDIGRTMESTASDITAIKEAEKERQSVTSQHTFIMYAIYFIFIGIVIGLSQTLIPLLNIGTESQSAGGIGGIFAFEDPCKQCEGLNDIQCINCPIFSGLCSMVGFEQGGSCYYNALFVLMAVVQGIFSGLVAGQIGEGSVSAGVKHSIIMSVTGFFSLIVILTIL
ncbi:MAG: type II secretion system F family protein [Candidatus Aenigmarchaeota archaeon]|nr:type II secretion system F family protein [Candidatus Aenigmarchaeota archaeon]